MLGIPGVSESWFAMGCDGGTIPKRHELVKGPKKVEKVSNRGPVGCGVPRERGEVGVREPAGFLTLTCSFELRINDSINIGPLLSACCCHSPGSTLYMGWLGQFLLSLSALFRPRN